MTKPEIRYPVIQIRDLINEEFIFVKGTKTGLLGSIDYKSFYITMGFMFAVSDKTTIGSEDSYIIGIKTNDEIVRIDNVRVGTDSQELDIIMHKDIELETNGNGDLIGDELDIRNQNFNFDVDTDTKFIKNASIEDEETDFHVDTLFGEQGVGGRRIGVSGGAPINWELEPNTEYALEFDNKEVAEVKLTFGISFSKLTNEDDLPL